MTNGCPTPLQLPLFPMQPPTLARVPERQSTCSLGHRIIQYEYSPGLFVPVRCYQCRRDKPDRYLTPV